MIIYRAPDNTLTTLQQFRKCDVFAPTNVLFGYSTGSSNVEIVRLASIYRFFHWIISLDIVDTWLTDNK